MKRQPPAPKHQIIRLYATATDRTVESAARAIAEQYPGAEVQIIRHLRQGYPAPETATPTREPSPAPVDPFLADTGRDVHTRPYACVTCGRQHPNQLAADLCCPVNELTDTQAIDTAARILGRRLGGIL